MNKFTIRCTPEQAKKALELGAPIYTTNEHLYRHPHEYKYWVEVDIQGNFYAAKIPTAEQMISWLEEQDIFVSINHISEGYSSWLKTISTNENISGNLGYVSSRKEAILASIDAALEYLENLKQ